MKGSCHDSYSDNDDDEYYYRQYNRDSNSDPVTDSGLHLTCTALVIIIVY